MQSEIEAYVPIKKKGSKKQASSLEILQRHQSKLKIKSESKAENENNIETEILENETTSKSIEIRQIEVEKIIDKEDTQAQIYMDIRKKQILLNDNNVFSESEVEEHNEKTVLTPCRTLDELNLFSQNLSDDIKKSLELVFTLAQSIFRQLGAGHTENIYHKALELELRLNGATYESEKRVLITYKSEKQPDKVFTLGEERIDLFLVDTGMIIELKATSTEPRQPELAQVIKYYRELNNDNKTESLSNVGIIINFPQPGPNKKAREEIDFVLICLAVDE